MRNVIKRRIIDLLHNIKPGILITSFDSFIQIIYSIDPGNKSACRHAMSCSHRVLVQGSSPEFRLSSAPGPFMESSRSPDLDSSIYFSNRE